jgi:hypothetical protein
MIAVPGRGPSALLPLRYLVTAAGAFVLAALSVPWLASELAATITSRGSSPSRTR